MSKAVQNKIAFSLKVLFLFFLLAASKFAKDEKSRFEENKAQNLSASVNQTLSPKVLPAHPTSYFGSGN